MPPRAPSSPARGPPTWSTDREGFRAAVPARLAYVVPEHIEDLDLAGDAFENVTNRTRRETRIPGGVFASAFVLPEQ